MPWYTGPFAAEVAAAKIRAGQDPTVARNDEDPEPDDTSSLLPRPPKAAVEYPALETAS